MSADLCNITGFGLCSGLNAWELAARSLGIKVVATAEIDADARIVASLNGTPHSLGDIRKINGSQIGPVDMVILSSSCKGFSHVGMRRGLEHPEGDTILHGIRIAAECSAKVLVTENVEGITNQAGGETFAIINGFLERFGFTPFEWRMLWASHFGLATTRPRWFAVSHRQGVTLRPLEWPSVRMPPRNIRSVRLPEDRVRDLYINDATFVPTSPKRPRTDPYRSLCVGYLAKPFIDRRIYSIDAPAPTFLAGLGGPGGPSRMYRMDDGRTRRLHHVEMLRAMGFPEGYRMPFRSFRAGKLIGNSLCPPVARSVIAMALKAMTGED